MEQFMKAKRERRPDTRRQKKQVSTYPSDAAWELLGGGASTVATAAVECWAQVLATATQDNEESFTPQQWEAMSDWLGGRVVHEIVNHSIQAPRVVVAMALTDSAYGADKVLEAVADKIRSMDYAHVWAVLWALDWRQRSGEGVAAAEWWTLGARLH
jgi:hypothetical protein